MRWRAVLFVIRVGTLIMRFRNWRFERAITLEKLKQEIEQRRS